MLSFNCEWSIDGVIESVVGWCLQLLDPVIAMFQKNSCLTILICVSKKRVRRAVSIKRMEYQNHNCDFMAV